MGSNIIKVDSRSSNFFIFFINGSKALMFKEWLREALLCFLLQIQNHARIPISSSGSLQQLVRAYFFTVSSSQLFL